MTEKCEEILETARGLITGNRRDIYGSARDDFTRTGKLWEQVLGVPVLPEQVALCMTLVKVGRLVNSLDHEDSWVDAAGYIALGGEIATTDAPLKTVEYKVLDFDADPIPHGDVARAESKPVTVDKLTRAERNWSWAGRNRINYRWRDEWQFQALDGGGWYRSLVDEMGDVEKRWGPFTRIDL